MIQSIFLDNNATTPLDHEVLEEMLRIASIPLNPSSVHAFGRKGSSLLLQSKETIASFLQVSSDELTFTSGGTESMNMLIRGIYSGKGTILSTKIEHPCSHKSLQYLEKQGVIVRYIPVDAHGSPTLDAIERSLTVDTSLMVFSAVYSETGAKLDLDGVAKLAERKNIPLIIDGVALLGKELFTLSKGITAMGFSSHKIHGPKGVGLSFIRKGTSCKPLLHGGSQQAALRPGTENIDGIVGFAQAVSLLNHYLPDVTYHMQKLKDLLIEKIISTIDGVHVHVKGPSICNTLSIGFDGIDGEALLFQLDRKGVMVSMGSACSSGALEPSTILLEMGISRKLTLNTLRISLSRMTSENEILEASDILCSLVNEQRRHLLSNNLISRS